MDLHRIDLHIPVVVDGGLTIGLQVVGVDHVHVVQIRGGGLIGQVHRVLEGQVPDGEGLKLGVARADAALVLVVELAQAGGHLAAAGAGSGDDDEAALGLDVVVFAEALLRDDQGHVCRVVGDDVVQIGADAQSLQPLAERVGNGLAPIVGDDHRADIEPDPPKSVDEAESVVLIGDAEVAAALGALDIVGRDTDDDLGVILHLQQHAHLAVRLKARQDARGVVIVKELAAKFQIQLAAKLSDAVADVLGLELQIFVVVKADAVHGSLSP